MTPPSPIERVSALPRPPDELLADALPVRGGGAVAPALELEAWVLSEILAPDRPLSIYEHEHLRPPSQGGDFDVRLGFLWCTEVERRSGHRTLGTCQLGEPTGRAWAAAQRRQQLTEWFGEVPTFLIVLDALHASHALKTGRPQDLLAVVDHELCHAGIRRDRYGVPRFSERTGEPQWEVRRHDVEQFVGPVRRWGLEATGMSEMAQAIDDLRELGPEVAPATTDGLCGTCKSPISP